MFHSDRGAQYTVFAFRKLLDSLHVVQSFSKKGYPFDNAVCEAFFKYLKKEETDRRTYHSFEELRLYIFEYIEGYYNSRRPHCSLGYLTPNEMELLLGFSFFIFLPVFVSTPLTILHKIHCRVYFSQKMLLRNQTVYSYDLDRISLHSPAFQHFASPFFILPQLQEKTQP